MLRFVKKSSGGSKVINIIAFIKFLSKRPFEREK